MSDPRKGIFDAFRAAAPGIFDDLGHVLALDNLCDAFGIPHDPPPRRINAGGIALIKSFESCELTAYRDAVGVLTIGYGSTGAHVKPGMTISQAQADELLRADLNRFELAVAAMASVATDNQFAAMVSLAFNVGAENLRGSTLLRLHNGGDYAGAQAQFSRWNRAGGAVLAGLTRRRAAEAVLYGRTS